MVNSDKPFDYSSQRWIGIGDKFPKKIHNATATSDGLMSAEDKAKLDSIDVNDHNSIYDIATWESDGLMAKEDKKKLDGIEENANNYVHPSSPEIRHVTDAQIEYWNAKASTEIVNSNKNGLMIAADKVKLDSIEANANNYTHPETHPATMIVEDSTHKFVTDEEKSTWDAKADTTIATTLANGLMSKEDKAKLNSIEYHANYYVHPNNEGMRHVTDAQIEYWNAKASKSLVTNSENGLMAYVDKIKLDGIEPNANYYVHPEDSQTRHVTDEQIELWSTKQIIDIATPSANGLMSKEDKFKLNTIETNANNYTHPETHPAAMIVEDSTHRFVTDEEKAEWSNTTYTNSTPTLNDFGGIPAGTTFDNVPITTLITRLLYPYIAPIVTVSSNPNGGTYEKGTSVNVTKVIVSITKKSEEITRVEVFDGNTSLGIKTDGSVGTLEFPLENISVNTNKNFTVNVTDAKGTVVTKNTGSFNFIYPYYYGVIDSSAEVTPTLISNLSKMVQSKGNKSVLYDTNNQKMVIAYPKSYGLLSKIIDPNQFDITNTFDTQEIAIMTADNISTAYYVYTSNTLSVVDYKVQFNY